MALTTAPTAADLQSTPRWRPAVPWLAVAIAALALSAVFLRVWRLGNIPGINGDEAWSGVQAAQLARGEPIAWWTPSGNPVNVFLLGPLAALHLVFAPSFVVLRSVAVTSGLAALAINYALCRRTFEPRTAIVSTLILAVLPINIAYSRFAWDASQSLLATLLVLYLPLLHYRTAKRPHALPVWAMVALAAALLVHPTNVFAAPLVVVPIAYARRRELARALRSLALPERSWALLLLVAAGAAAAYFAWQVLDRAAHPERPAALAAFLRHYVGLFSGATVYRYIAGVDAAEGSSAAFAWLPAACNLLVVGIAVPAIVGLVSRLRAQRDDRDACLVWGWLVMIVGFFAVAGPAAIAPHFERYGICLVAPGALVLARGLVFWIEPERSWAGWARWGLVGAAWCLLAGFWLGYFAFIERTGGCSHRAFRTAAVEPKQAAFDAIADRAQGQGARVVADDWWSYWPLAYLAMGRGDLRVVPGEAWIDPARFSETLDSERAWVVEFLENRRNSPAGRTETRRPSSEIVILDYAGRPLLSVAPPAESGRQN